MALIKCKECGNEISKKAKTCPKCGAPVKQGSSFGGLLTLFVVIVILVAVWPDTDSTYSTTSKKSTHTSTSKYTPPAPPLELISWRCETEHGYMFVRGEVKNVSSKSLDNVTVVGEFRTADGTLVKSDSALIDYNPILPGQTSPFSTGTSVNPAFKRCGINFKHLLGGTIGFTSKQAESRERIAEVQRLLNKHGYTAGTADGVMGPNTRHAIRSYQTDAGLNVDGKVSDSLLSALRKK